MKKYATFKFDKKIGEKFLKFKQKHGLTYGVVLDQMLDFFERTNLSPTDMIDNNILGLEKLIKKRTDVIIQFIKTSETKYLFPMQVLIENMALTEKKYVKSTDSSGQILEVKNDESNLSSEQKDEGKKVQYLEKTEQLISTDQINSEVNIKELLDELETCKNGKRILIDELKSILSKVERINNLKEKYYKLNISKTEFDALQKMVNNF